MREILFLILFFYLFINCSNKEGFYSSFYNKLSNIHQTNLNTDNKYPDRTIFYPVANHVKVKLGDKQQELLGNYNYRVIKNTIKEPQHGVYSAFLDVNKLRSYDHFYHAPITDKRYRKDFKYDRFFRGDGQEIIQEKDRNKYELYKDLKEIEEQDFEPFDLFGHPSNNSKILYSDEIQERFLKIKDETNRYVNVSHKGLRGYSKIS
jgi:hypothetical protein